MNLLVKYLRPNYELPQIIECNKPNECQEIPTPDVVDHFEHLGGVTISPVNKKIDIILLIGRDVPDVHRILKQRIRPKTALPSDYPLAGSLSEMYDWVTYRLHLHLRVSTRLPSLPADDQQYLNSVGDI